MTRSELRQLQWQKLGAGLHRLRNANPFYQQKLHSLPPNALDAPEDLANLPFTTKHELLADQEKHPPYGTNLTQPPEKYLRLHQTSGTSGRRLRWLDTSLNWDWFLECWQEIFDAVGIQPNDRFFVPFSFGPFLGFWAAFEGAIRRGCFTLAGGGMTTHARLQAIIEHQITVICTTPTYARHLLEIARDENINLASSAVRRLILAGEPGANVPPLRAQLETGWGARVIDHSGMTEIGSLGIEFDAYPGKLFLLENHCIAEFIDPNTLAPVPEGNVGELVLTNLGRWDSPLLRYRTGDMVRWRADISPPGKPFVYLDGGILGRVDDMLWIKGNNVYPSTLEAVLRQHPDVAEFRIELNTRAHPPDVTLLIEPTATHTNTDLLRELARDFQDRLLFRPEMRLVPPGSLPRPELKAQRIDRV